MDEQSETPRFSKKEFNQDIKRQINMNSIFARKQPLK